MSSVGVASRSSSCVVEVVVDLDGRWRPCTADRASTSNIAFGSIFSGCRMPSRRSSIVRRSLSRQPHQAEEHRRREQLGELLGEVALAAIDERVDELVDAARDVGLLLVHALGREQRVDQLAVLRVLGRVDVERDQRPHVAERHVDVRREQLVVAQHEVVELAAEHHDDAVHRAMPCRPARSCRGTSVAATPGSAACPPASPRTRRPRRRRLVGLLIGHVGPPEARRAATIGTRRPGRNVAAPPGRRRSAERFGIRFVDEPRHELTRDAVAASDVGQGLTLGVQDLEEETLGVVATALQLASASARLARSGCGSITCSRSTESDDRSRPGRVRRHARRACRRARSIARSLAPFDVRRARRT